MKTRSPIARRTGNVAVLVALTMPVMIGVLALALDAGVMMAEERRAQSVADAGAHAAACLLAKNMSSDSGLDPQGTARAAALAFASGNGYTNNGTTSSVTVNIPPQSGTFSGTSGYAEVKVTRMLSRTFSSFWGAGSLSISSRSVARIASKPASPSSVILLEPSAANSLVVAGGGHIVANTGIQVNSSSSTAVNANNTGYVTAPSLNIKGGYVITSSGKLNTTVTTGAPTVSDPLASLSVPDPSTLTTRGSVPTYGTFTINPGVYNGGITFGGGSVVTMNPGIYYMKGGSFTVANGVKITGNGVMVFVDNGGGSISFQGGGLITLSPMTSGAYKGIVMYQDRRSSASINIANGTGSNIAGTVYAAGSPVVFAGGSNYTQLGSQYICKTLNISNNANIVINYASSSVAGKTGVTIVE